MIDKTTTLYRTVFVIVYVIVSLIGVLLWFCLLYVGLWFLDSAELITVQWGGG